MELEDLTKAMELDDERGTDKLGFGRIVDSRLMTRRLGDGGKELEW